MFKNVFATAIFLTISFVPTLAHARPVHAACNVSMPCLQIATDGYRTALKLSIKRLDRQGVGQASRAARGRAVVKTAKNSGLVAHGQRQPKSEKQPVLSTSLVARARAYLGTNPTGWARVWCGRFMAMIAPEAAARIRNPNMARNWAGLPHVQGRVGAIAVMRHHVGVVSGFDQHGNPIIVSGNHSRRVGEGTYSARRVLAYVSI